MFRVDQVKADFEAARAARLKLFDCWKSSIEVRQFIGIDCRGLTSSQPLQTGAQYVDSNSLKEWVSGPLKKLEKPKKQTEIDAAEDLVDAQTAPTLAAAEASTSAVPMDADPPVTNGHSKSASADKVASEELKGPVAPPKINNSAITCPHGFLLPSKVGQSKQISEASSAMLVYCFP